jgi:hypothetical protein
MALGCGVGVAAGLLSGKIRTRAQQEHIRTIMPMIIRPYFLANSFMQIP